MATQRPKLAAVPTDRNPDGRAAIGGHCEQTAVPAIDDRAAELRALRRELLAVERGMAHVHELERRLAELSALAAALAKQVDGLESENARLNAANLMFLTSRSWRTTRPLRAVRSRLRRHR